MAKVRIIKDNSKRFGGLQVMMQSDDWMGLLSFVDRELGKRTRDNSGFRYSDVLNALFGSVLAGSSAIEDVNKLREELYNPDSGRAVPSADTVLRTLSQLSVKNEEVRSERGHRFQFNRNTALNRLLTKSLVHLGLVNKVEGYDFDYDNIITEHNKFDALPTYKDCKGYAPGVAYLDGLPFYIEGRSGNAPVVFDQLTTLKNALGLLHKEGLKVKRFRMDAGSYTRDVIGYLSEEESGRFYIRSHNKQYTTDLVNESTRGWRGVRLNNGDVVEVRSIENSDFISGKAFREVILRRRRKEMREEQRCLSSEWEYKHFSIITNDLESSEEAIIHFYNQRGAIERHFDELNNDYNWSHQPASDLHTNTTFMILMALLYNFKKSFTIKLAELTHVAHMAKCRMKSFIFSFVSCVAQYIKEGDGWVLYLHNPPDVLECYANKVFG